jgi:hypothetical protein
LRCEQKQNKTTELSRGNVKFKEQIASERFLERILKKITTRLQISKLDEPIKL